MYSKELLRLAGNEIPKLRVTVNQELNKARRQAGSERLETINRWLVAMDLIDMADNLIEELSNGNS